MSHTATVKAIKIQSVSALRAAVEELAQSGIKCSLIENAVPRAYYSNQQGMGLADFVLKLDSSPYDVGIYKTDGGFEARTDFFMNHVSGLLGVKASSDETREQAQMGKLFQMYATHAGIEAARKKGYMVQRKTKEDGTIQLLVDMPG